MSDKAVSSQGTLVSRAPAATPSTFTTIAELRDITPPELSRNAIETTAHNDQDNYNVAGVRRKGELKFKIGLLTSGAQAATHDALTGLIKSWKDGSCDIWKTLFPDGGIWTFSGYITGIAPSQPVDGGQEADITVTPTGIMTFAP